MRRLVMLSLLSALVVVPASAARAAAPQPLAVSAMAPADGAGFEAFAWVNYGTTLGIPTSDAARTLTFSVDATPPRADATLVLEVTTSTLPGQDGTLADDFIVGYASLERSDAFPSHYSTTMRVQNPWLWNPGTYYWQVHTPTTTAQPAASPARTRRPYAPSSSPRSRRRHRSPNSNPSPSLRRPTLSSRVCSRGFPTRSTHGAAWACRCLATRHVRSPSPARCAPAATSIRSGRADCYGHATRGTSCFPSPGGCVA